MDRRLQSLPDSDLRALWQELAPLVAAQRDPISGGLPAAYQKRLDALVAEFKRRGVQLALF